MSSEKWNIPDEVGTIGDLGKIQRELESLDDFLQQSEIRSPGSNVTMPKTSNIFEELVSMNGLNMLKAEDRKSLRDFLENLRDKAPVVHMSFSATPSPQFVQKLTTWIRKNLHNFAFLQIGMNPSIGVGCVVRTTNKVFDFSLSQKLKEQESFLNEQIHNLGVSNTTGEQEVVSSPDQQAQIQEQA